VNTTHYSLALFLRNASYYWFRETSAATTFETGMLVLFVFKLRKRKKRRQQTNIMLRRWSLFRNCSCLNFSLFRDFILQFKSSERIRITAVYFMGIPLDVTGRVVCVRS